MDRQLIKTLIDALQASTLSELEYAKDGETIRLSKAARSGTPSQTRTVPAARPDAAPLEEPGPVPAAPATSAPVPGGVPPVCAPLFGVVHLRPAPEAPFFVTPGQAVEANQVLCTVEAMKVFTEVRTAVPGIVAAVAVTDGQEIEPGQVLVRLDPTGQG